MESASTKTEKSEEYARNTAFYLFDFLINHGRHGEFFNLVLGLLENENLRFDPIEDALTRAIEFMRRERGSRSEIQKIRGRLEYLKREIEKKSNWFDLSARERVIGAATTVAQALAKAPQQQHVG